MSSSSSSLQSTSSVGLLKSLIEQASDAYGQGDPTSALAFYDQAVLIDPTNHVLYANRSAILLKLDRPKEAVQQANYSIQLNPRWPKAYFRKGEALKATEEFEKAILAFCQGLQLEPENEQLLIGLINCAAVSQIKERFEKILRQMSALGLDRSPFVIVSVVGQEFLAIGNCQDAITILNCALTIDSTSLKLKESTNGALATAHYQTGNYRKASDYMYIQLEIAEQLNNPRSQISIHANIAQLALKQHELARAILHRRKQIDLLNSLNESSDAALVALGELYLIANEVTRAREMFTSTEKTNVYAQLGHARALMAEGSYAEANDALATLEKTTGNMRVKANAILFRCRCLLALREPQKAAGILKAHVLRDSSLSNDEEMIGHFFAVLGECQLATGDWITARKWANKALKIGLSNDSIPLKTDAFRILSQLFEVTKDTRNALCLAQKLAELLESANAQLPVQTAALSRLGNLLYSTGDWEKALEVFRKRLDLASRLACAKTLMEAHSDLARLYKSLGDEKNRVKHIDEQEQYIQGESSYEWIYFEDLADLKVDRAEIDEAKELYEKALMGVQEQNNAQKEATICAKLGDLHQKMESFEEAAFYFHQNLTLNKQTKNLENVLRGYASLGKIHYLQKHLEEALEFHRYQLTLARILNDTSQKLDALIGIGQVFTAKKDFSRAVRIFSKARRIAEFNGLKNELAMCHGRIGECYVEMGDRSRALSHYCKQLLLFPYMSDCDSKCASLSYLITEKSHNGDIVWSLKLCEMRVDIAKSSKSTHLLSRVLAESSNTVASLGCFEKAASYLSEAVALGLQNEHEETGCLILKLADLYERLGQYSDGLNVLQDFVENVDNSPEYSLRLVTFLFHRKDYDKAEELLRSLDQTEEVSYALAACLYRKTDLYGALKVLRNCTRITDAEHIAVDIQSGFVLNAIGRLERVVYWDDYRTQSVTLQRLLEVFDDLDAYDVINPNLLDHLSITIRIHYEMSLGNWEVASQLLEIENGMEFEKFVVAVCTGQECHLLPKATVAMGASDPIQFVNVLTSRLNERLHQFANAIIEGVYGSIQAGSLILYSNSSNNSTYYVNKTDSDEVLPQFYRKMLQKVLETMAIPEGNVADVPVQKEDLNNNTKEKLADISEILKTFEIREKWRRKGRRKQRSTARGYASDGEVVNLNNTTVSDCELTDTESVSGAKVIGVDFEDDYDSSFQDASFY
ncbi:hypothetical protein QR680_014849 [Steinernema hermaphroditum]|uniref:MalT-like TPR region domain-containing protein n=1 Tax=Steinernema hermaphroditum TaxID=289476 RepID=A0AA39IBX3_9BILA|nr:hypothetical protein QR680_014849 [Steinernema hermaphroditum]